MRIGLDFGTAFTKVAVSVAGTIHFVDWGGLRKGEDSHLLPGQVSRDAEGNVWLGRYPGARVVVSELKLPLLSMATDASMGADSRLKLPSATVFLAWVMRYTRAWLYKELQSLLASRRLVWELNIGCPTDVLDVNQLKDRYCSLAVAAWWLSQCKGVPSFRLAQDALERSHQVGVIGLDHVAAVPEFAAQIAGYAKSPQRRPDLHLLVDCGAGTLDVVTFNVHRGPKDGIDRFPVFVSSVRALGTHFLMETLLGGQSARRAWHDVERVPSIDELAKARRIARQTLEERQLDFENRIAMVVRSVLWNTKQRRYPSSRAWKEGLPVFLTGGGAACEVYKKAVDRACGELGVPPRHTPFPRLTGPRSMPAQQEFHRLSVAYGLCFDAEAIGRVVPASEVDDFVQAQSPVRDRPDRDDLYAR